jgi:transposase
MANVLSMDLRVRFKTLMDQGLCAAAAGKMLLVSPATAARWGKKGREGASLEPHPSGPRKGRGRPEPFMPVFLELIEQDPDITLAELQAALLAAHDVTASTSGIDALLRRHGSSYKKGLIAEDRRKPEMRKG